MSKSGLIKLILLTADIVLMYASLFLVLAFRYHDFSVFPGPQTRQFFSIFLLSICFGWDCFTLSTCMMFFW